MAEERAKRKLSAILSADVKGYSRLMGENEVATVRTLKDYRELMSKLIKEYRGRVVDSPGDNLLAEFASVVDALECSIEIQRNLKIKNAALPDTRKMEFRIGVNLGDVIEDEDRVYGDGVNIAARLEGLAEAGGICISGTAFDHIKNKLWVGYQYLGKQTVKNIPDPVRAYKVLMEPESAGKVIGEKEPKQRKWGWKALAVVAVVILVVGGLVWNFYGRAPKIETASKEKMAFPLPDKPSIAVLPFVNMSSNPEHDPLADSLSENIIYTLSYLPGMFVISRNSTFTYKGKPVEIRQVAEQLGVRYVLEGSVLRAEDRVRVTAQLIDATTGYHLWSGRFDRTLNDIFSLLDEITKNIAIALQVKMSPDQWAVLTHKTENFDAWAAATRAYSLLLLGAGEEAQKLAEKAVALDAKYGFGWAVLAALHTLRVYYGLSQSPSDSIKLAAECNEKALTLDPTLSCATANRGQIHLLQGNVEEAIAFGKKAIDMAPSLDANYIIFGMTMDFAGRFEEAIPLFKSAMRLNPFYPARYLKFYGMSCLMANRKEDALTAFRELLQRSQRGESPPPMVSHLGLIAVYEQLGREIETKTHLEEILKINPNFSLEEASKVHRWRDRKYSEQWLSSLRKAGLPEKPPLPLPDKPSIAVLPFVNMSDEKSQEYLSDGLTEEIITALSKLPDIFVIARNSSFVYKGKPVNVQQVSRELGVKYVLEGSVRRSGDQLRITAQLIDATTGNHLWAERYDRQMKDLFALQDKITLEILKSLDVKLSAGDRARFWGKGTENLEAYIKFLESREIIAQRNKDSNVKARPMAEEIIRLDPHYPTGYYTLAILNMMDVVLGISKSPRDSLIKAIELCEKAVSLDDSHASAHALLGFLYVHVREHDKGVIQAERAIEIAPHSSDAHSWLAQVLNYTGRAQEAAVHMDKAFRLNPLAPPAWYYAHAVHAYRLLGRYEDSVKFSKEMLMIAPKDFAGHLGLVMGYAALGRDEEAQAAAQEFLRTDPKFSAERYARSQPYKDAVQAKNVLELMLKAGLPE
jgi:adenylate cyclase